MNVINTAGSLPFAIGLAAVLGVSIVDAASLSMHAGALCKPLSREDAGFASYGSGAIQALKPTGEILVTCPLVRQASGAAPATAFVEIDHVVEVSTTSCSFVSFDWRGLPMRATGDSWTGIGPHLMVLGLPAGSSNAWSRFVVFCTLPQAFDGSAWRGVINGIGLYEQ